MKNYRAGMRPLMASGLAVVFGTIGFASARADEVSDLRANNELLQQRLDQIAQMQNNGPSRLGLGDVQAMTAQATAGSFPRSFLIPGTDTSIRVGGQITEVVGLLVRRRPAERQPAEHDGQRQRPVAGDPARRSGFLAHQQHLPAEPA